MIDAGRVVTVFGRGQPSYRVRLYARTALMSQYAVIRAGTFDREGRVVFRVPLLANTRMRLNSACGGDSRSVAVDVRGAVSLVATGRAQRYTFSGSLSPARSNVVVTVFRVTGDGRRVAVASTRTRAGGRYSVTKTFIGTGTHRFRAETRADRVNRSGASPLRAITLTRAAPVR